MGTPAQDAKSGSRRGPLSLWAAASVVCSVLLCPPLCVIGPLLGAVGLHQTRPGGGHRGRRLAIAGIAIGLAATALWIVAAGWWHANVRRPMLEGPREVLAAGLAGDVDGFMDGFHVTGPPPSRAEARAFLDEFRRRYGSIRHLDQDPDALPSAAASDTRRPLIPYRMRCDRGTLRLEAVFVRTSGTSSLPMILKWGALVVRDPERGDLIYPVSATAVAAPPEPDPTDE